MKKRLFFTILSLSVMLFSSCQHDVFLPNPNIPAEKVEDDKIATVWNAPKNLKSTQGRKQYIELTWSPVKDAVRYNIYRADNEFNEFQQVGETKKGETNFTLKPKAGYDKYYRVSAVDSTGVESELSNIVRATTLARPIVNDISGEKSKEDSNVFVSWYMNNMDAYVDDIYYEVLCLDEKGNAVKSKRVPGKDTVVFFEGLNPSTTYFYKVEVYNTNNEYEESDIVNAKTARRLRPDPVKDFAVTQGISKDNITLSFLLPNYVDIIVEKDVFEPKPLYFKIYRREYKEGENNTPFECIKSDFGITTKTTDGKSEWDYTKVSFDKESPDGYKPGLEVIYEDNSSLERGVKYEYKVESYAYVERVITSDKSIANTEEPGWMLPNIKFGTDKIEYTFSEDKKQKLNASLKFNFGSDMYNIPYKYKLYEIKKSLDQTKTDEPVALTFGDKDYTKSIDEINNFVRQFNLKDDQGYYSYKISVFPDSETDTTEIDSYSAIGQSLVTESMKLPEVGEIKVTYGFADKIRLEWNWDDANQYILKYEDNDGTKGEFTHEQIINVHENGKPTVIFDDTTAKPGIERIYVLSVYGSGLSVFSDKLKATVPEKPDLRPIYAYDKISLEVKNGQKAYRDNYEVAAVFEDTTLNSKYRLELINPDNAPNIVSETVLEPEPLKFDYKIVKSGQEEAEPVENSIDSDVAGARVKVTVTENKHLTTDVYQHSELQEDNSKTVEAGNLEVNEPIEKLKSELITATVGPALIGTSASHGKEFKSISVKWNKVLGANTYVVFRDRYHIGNNRDNLIKQLPNSEKYIVTLEKDGTVKIRSEEDPGIFVKASYNAEDETFTLEDIYRPYNNTTEYDSVWKKGQGEIIWGAPNKYTVIPVISPEDADIATKKEAEAFVTVKNFKFNNPICDLGSTRGFGWNVKASKGTYSGPNSTDSSNNKTNNGIKITWTEPYYGNTVGYNLYRRRKGTYQWENLESVVQVSEYVDKYITEENLPPSHILGELYEYFVVDANYDGEPDNNFIESIDKDSKNDSFGFMMQPPKISSVSRDDIGIGKEEVKFFPIKIDDKENNMIDGYVIQVRNNNIDEKWHDIKTITKKEFENMDDNFFTRIVNNDDGLLKVLRDYKHYFRIRAYTEVNGEKIYSMVANNNFKNDLDTPYVKWGCRQISIDEFTRAVNLLISQGVYYVWENEKSDNTITYSPYTKVTPKAGTFKFNYFKKESITKAKNSVLFLRIKGNLSTEAWGLYKPSKYKCDEVINIDAADSGVDLYSGKIQYFNTGKMNVSYGKENKEYDYDDVKGEFCPLVIGQGASGWGVNKREYLNDEPEWQ